MLTIPALCLSCVIIVVFSKSYCPYCKSTKSTLGSFDAKFATYELNQEADGAEIQSALAGMTGQRTVPNIFIGKVHIGGNSDLEEAVRNGKDGKSFKELLANAGAL